MTTTISLTIEHGGKTYSGKIGSIEKTSLGVEHHGIFTASLSVVWSGGGIGVGDYCLDTPHRDDDGKHLGRIGTAYGLDYIMRILETVGVDTWERLQFREVIVLFPEGSDGWGSSAVGIAGVTNGKVLVFKDHVDSFKGE